MGSFPITWSAASDFRHDRQHLFPCRQGALILDKTFSYHRSLLLLFTLHAHPGPGFSFLDVYCMKGSGRRHDMNSACIIKTKGERADWLVLRYALRDDSPFANSTRTLQEHPGGGAFSYWGFTSFSCISMLIPFGTVTVFGQADL